MKSLKILLIAAFLLSKSSLSFAYSSDPKEFVREWLIDNNFQGLPKQKLPEMTTHFVSSVSKRYIELYEKIMGKSFIKNSSSNILNRVHKNLKDYLENF